MPRFASRRGHSLVESLVVIAIIAILFATQAPALSRAVRAARQMEAQHSIRQEGIGRMADNANSDRTYRRASVTRDEARAAFRRAVKVAQGEILVTEMLYEVRTEAEFRAYWHTLIDPAASAALEFDGGYLEARDPESGETFELRPVEESFMPSGDYVRMWEFLTTRGDSSTASTGRITIMKANGQIDALRYPGEFPAVRVVAELSQRFADAYPD